MILQLVHVDDDIYDIYGHELLMAIGKIAAKFPDAAISVYNEWNSFRKCMILSAMKYTGGKSETIISFLQKLASDRGCDSQYRSHAI